MAKRPLPTPEELRQLLDYDPASGRLTWKPRGPEFFSGRASSATICANRWNGNYAGKTAGHIKSHGYVLVGIWGVEIRAHRIAWAIMHGTWPTADIDHINGDRADNRIANLRDVTRAVNMRNQRFKVRTTTGVVGVSQTREGKFRAAIGWGKSFEWLGTFATVEEASVARKQAEHRLGYHKDHGSERAAD